MFDTRNAVPPNTPDRIVGLGNHPQDASGLGMQVKYAHPARGAHPLFLGIPPHAQR